MYEYSTASQINFIFCLGQFSSLSLSLWCCVSQILEIRAQPPCWQAERHSQNSLRQSYRELPANFQQTLLPISSRERLFAVRYIIKEGKGYWNVEGSYLWEWRRLGNGVLVSDCVLLFFYLEKRHIFVYDLSSWINRWCRGAANMLLNYLYNEPKYWCCLPSCTNEQYSCCTHEINLQNFIMADKWLALQTLLHCAYLR